MTKEKHECGLIMTDIIIREDYEKIKHVYDKELEKLFNLILDDTKQLSDDEKAKLIAIFYCLRWSTRKWTKEIDSYYDLSVARFPDKMGHDHTYCQACQRDGLKIICKYSR